MNSRLFILVTLALITFSSCGQKDLQTIVRESNIPKNELVITIDKTNYTLSVSHKDKKLITYPCVFGFNAVDDKHQEGDGCTPEGTFKIRSMYAHKSWKYFIWIDYPNQESWRRFNKRKADGVIPKTATVGGEVGIHGVPEGSDSMIAEKYNWTLGCISLTNADITDLYRSIGSGTMIKIIH
jgi:murein L,D-transpeptidase YafK